MSQWIVNVTDETFESEVLERSASVPVVVDFWAQWCGPCRALGPLLENLAGEYDGKFILAKVDTEQAPMSAANFRVQSIPAVYGIRDGKIVDGFLGAIPEPEIRSWLDKLLPSETDMLVAEAKLLAAADVVEAEAKLRRACELDPNHAHAHIELAELLLSEAKLDECAEVVGKLEDRGFLEPEAERVKSALEIQRHGSRSGGVEACRSALSADPGNLTLKIDLAEALAASESHEEALQLALSIVQEDQGDHRERARQTMVDIFRLLPPDSELTAEYRRKLSLALF